MDVVSNHNLLNHIKNKYILKIIVDNLEQKALLNLVKYNKNLQQLLDIGINDYKTYKKIEIEMQIIPYKKDKNYFINIPKMKESYFHIYFNNEIKEVNRNYFTKDDNIIKVKIIIDEEIKSFKNLFKSIDCIEKINFIKFNRKDISNMSYMFYNCSSLKDINLSNFKTDNVKNMRCLFYNCSSLQELNLSSFKTDNVKDMWGMFYTCSSLKELNLNNFNTNKVKDMYCMFRCCWSLKKLNINNFETYNVTNMCFMFEGCSSLEELNLINFNFNEVTKMKGMFRWCSSLKELYINNLNNLNNINEIDMRGMFFKCSNELIMKIKTQFKNIKNEAFLDYI